MNKTTQKNMIGFFENVCSSRTNSELLQNLRKQNQCNIGVENYD
jgi:hypothetical protein